MTDRVKILVVHLDKEMRVDDVEIVKSAISMIKCVKRVENGPTHDFFNEEMETDRIKREVAEELDEISRKLKYGGSQ